MIYGYCRAVPWAETPDAILDEQTRAVRTAYPQAELVREVASSDSESSGLTDLLDRVQDGDVVVFPRMEDFGFSMKEVLGVLEMLWDSGVTVHILNLGIFDGSPQGLLLRKALTAYEEFERAHINERITRGKYLASQQPGFRDGRPFKYSRKQLQEALALLKDHSYKQVEELTGISKSTLIREKRKLNLS